MRQGRLRWLLVPWTDRGLLLVIALAAAAPAFLLSAADAWQAAAQDQLAAQIATTTDRTSTGPRVQSEVLLDNAALELADREINNRIAEIGGGDSMTRSTYTLPMLGSAGGEALGVGLRFLGRDGVFDDVEIVEGTATADGVIVSSWAADELGLEIGDTLTVEAVKTGDLDTNDVVPGGGTTWTVEIDGLYSPLWTEGSVSIPTAWADVPALVPRFLPPFGRPSFALVLADEELLWSSGMSGVVRWQSATDVPTTLEGMHRLRRDYRSIENDLIHDPAIAAALDAVATPVDGRPELTTGLYETAASLDQAVRRLGEPLRAARRAGILLGLATMVGAGLAFVERRRADYLLLAAQGDRWIALTARSITQLISPVLLGAAGGTIIGVGAAATVGPADRLNWNALDVSALALLATASLVLASLTAGLVGQATLERSAYGRAIASVAERLALSALVVLSAILWVTVGEGSGPGSELGAVLAPIAILAAAVGCTLLGFETLVRHARAWGDRFGFVGFMVWRRLVTNSAATRLAAGAFGVGLGMAIYSSVMTGALERGIETRSATEVGANVRLDLFGEIPAPEQIPERTTLVRVQDTRLTPTGQRLRVVAIDPSTFADAVRWPEEFGSSAAKAVSTLASHDLDVIPAIAIDGEGVPDTGGFGGRTVHPFQVVDRISSLPLANEFAATILISTDQLDELALRRFLLADTGLNPPRAPSSHFRVHLLSDLSLEETMLVAESNDINVRRIETIAARTSDPDIVAIRTSLDYQRLLGAVAGAVAVVGLVMMIGARRKKRRVAHAMTAAMGVASSRTARVTGLELGLLVTVASTIATVVAMITTTRLLPRLDPTPRIPPALDLDPSPVLLLLVVVTTGVGSAVLAWSTDRFLGRGTTTLDSDDR